MGTPYWRRLPAGFYDDDSESETSFAHILQYILKRTKSSFTKSKNDPKEENDPNGLLMSPNTEELNKSVINIITQQSAGLINKHHGKRPKSVTGMVCARERGMQGSIAFSKADCCRINNYFLPNKNSVVGCFSTKLFCGLYLNDGNTFLSASQDRLIRLFDTSPGKFVLKKSILARDVGWSILDVGISPDGNYLAYSSWCQSLQLCKIWENSETQDALLLCSDDRKFCVFSLKFSSTGKEIVCGANDGLIYVYDLERNQIAFKMIGHDDDVNTVSFADDRSHILYSGGDDGICKVWDRRTLSESHPKPVGLLAGHMLGITYVEPRGDGRHLITNSKDQSIKLWDVRRFSSDLGIRNTREAVFSQDWDYRWKSVPESLKNPFKRLEGDTSIMTYFGHSVVKTLSRCHFSPVETTGQRYIYTGCASGRVIVYDILSGKIRKILYGHRGCVRDVAWHPYRPEITSTGWDGKIFLWTYENPLWEFDSEEEDKNVGTKRKASGSVRKRSQRIADRKARMSQTSSQNYVDNDF